VPEDRATQEVARLEQTAKQSRSGIDRFATAITRRAGTGTAILVHAIWFSVWIALNLRLFAIEPFDPFPFSLLTTIVSLEAIFLTLFVLISQNRMSREADRRAALDLEINILAERESTMTLRILNDISSHLGVKGDASKELAELVKETRLEVLSSKLEKVLPPEE
jgi:uncharacterized membrane protein